VSRAGRIFESPPFGYYTAYISVHYDRSRGRFRSHVRRRRRDVSRNQSSIRCLAEMRCARGCR
jgi:hypothetical protein